MHRPSWLTRSNALCDRTLSLLKSLPEGATSVALADALDERIADTEQALDRLTKLGMHGVEDRHWFSAAVVKHSREALDHWSPAGPLVVAEGSLTALESARFMQVAA